jgi:[ribosomal protein S18]-alanine N-acetyltransferase
LSDVRLRGYRSGDVEAMVRLDSACFSEAFRFDAGSMREFAETPGAVVRIAEDAATSEMVGFLILHVEGGPGARYGYVVTIDVAPALRRAGIGGRMLVAAESLVEASGVGRVGLHVAVNNAAAIRFYERQGYEQGGIARRFYREAGLDALIYVKNFQ